MSNSERNRIYRQIELNYNSNNSAEISPNYNAAKKHNTIPLISMLDYGTPQQLEIARLWISQKKGLSEVDVYGNTPLHAARKATVTEALIKAGADINARTKDGNTALSLAAARGYPKIVSLLLAADADINTKANNGNTPLMNAILSYSYGAEDKYLMIVRLLLEHGADTTNTEGATAFYYAIQKSNTALVKLLLDHKVNPNIVFNDGETPLMKAIHRMNYELINLLISVGADVDKPNVENGVTPLMAVVNPLSSRLGVDHQVEIAQLLISKGADVNKESLFFNTALTIAIQGSVECVHLLLNNGANVNHQMPNGVTPLILTIATAHRSTRYMIMEMLIKAGADVNAKTDTGATALGYATIKNDINGLNILISHGATIDNLAVITPLHGLYVPYMHEKEMTELMYAIAHPHYNIISTLVGAGADVNFVTPTNETPLHIAARSNNPAIVRYLIKHDADVSLPDATHSVKSYAERGMFYPDVRRLILSATAPKKSVEIPIKNISQPNTNVFDPVMFMEVPFAEALADESILIFKVGAQFFSYPIEQLKRDIATNSGVIYECKEELHGAPWLKDVHLETPYFLLRSAAIYVVPLAQIKQIIRMDSSSRLFELVESSKRLPFTASYGSVMADNTGRNQSGRPVNIVSADHCQAKSDRATYTIQELRIVKSNRSSNNNRNTKKAGMKQGRRGNSNGDRKTKRRH